jgi:uncharacterized membrane protein
MKRWTFATIALLFLLLPLRGALRADQVQYTVEDLGTIDGLVPTVTGINASGQVSGHVTLPDGSTRAVRYTNGLGWTFLPGLEATHSAANGINRFGDVVGIIVASGMQLGFRYTDTAGVEAIFPLAGGTFTSASAINDSGVVVGFADSGGVLQAFRASPGLPPQALPGLGGAFAMACGINDAGQIAGSAATPAGVQHAVRFEIDGTVTDVGTFDGPAGTSSGCAIDSDGRLGGNALSGGLFRAFRFSGGTLANLDAFGSGFSTVEAISAGTSVGWYLPADASPARAFIHTDATGSIDLNSLIAPEDGWLLGEAKGVSVEGQIVGHGTLNGVPRAFRLTPTQTADTTAPVIDRVAASPSLITPPNGAMIPVTVLVSVTDDVDAAPACSITGIASPGAADGDFSFDGLSALVRAVPGRTYTLSVACSDAAGNASQAATTSVEVAPDTTAPVIGLLVATPSRIWPPNGRMVDVQLTVAATDDVDPSPSCALTGVRGMNAGDAEITGPLSARVRAKKDNDGSDRTYYLQVTCTDSSGNSARRSVTVTVAKGDGNYDDYARALLRKLYDRLHDRYDRRGDRDHHGRSGDHRR